MTEPMPTGANLLVLAAIEALPDVMGFIRDMFKKKNPDQPPPTEPEIFAALAQAFATSLAKDDQWLKDHPEEGEPPK